MLVDDTGPVVTAVQQGQDADGCATVTVTFDGEDQLLLSPRGGSLASYLGGKQPVPFGITLLDGDAPQLTYAVQDGPEDLSNCYLFTEPRGVVDEKGNPNPYGQSLQLTV